MQIIKRIFQGFLIGIATLVPGVSGGSMAIILDVYDELLTAVTTLHRHFIKSVTTLMLYSVGAIIGLYGLAPMMVILLHYEYELMVYLFMGIMCGGISLILRPCKQEKLTLSNGLCFIMGGLLVIVMAQTPKALFMFETPLTTMQILFMVLAGILVAVALVLPGLSASFVLFMLGIYDVALSAACDLYLPILIPLGIGLVIGTLGSANLIKYCLAHYPAKSYLFTLGIIVASLVMMFPGILVGNKLVLSFVLFGVGFLLTSLMSRFSESIK